MISIRLQIVNRAGTQRLERRGGLPVVDVPSGGRGRPDLLVERVVELYGLDVCVLRLADDALVELELLGPLPPGSDLRWAPHALAPPPAERAWWHRPGWLTEAVAAADDALGALGHRRIGPPRQARQTSVTGMVVLPTDAGPLWLKALPPLFAHEGDVVAWLQTVAPGTGPALVAQGPGWWLAEQFPATAPGPPDGDVLEVLADLHAASSEHVAQLGARGWPVRPVAALPERLEEIARREGRPDDVRERVLGRLDDLVATCEAVAGLGFPDVLVHGDVHPENVAWTERGWFLFDWTDACVGHPLVDLALPLSFDALDLRPVRAARYGARWRGRIADEAIDAGLALTPAIGAAHQAVTYQTIMDRTEGSAADPAGAEQLQFWLDYWLEELVAALGERSASPSGR